VWFGFFRNVESVAQYGMGEALIHREREYVESSKLPAFLNWAEVAGVSDLFWTEALKESLASRHSPYARSLFFNGPETGRTSGRSVLRFTDEGTPSSLPQRESGEYWSGQRLE
jgi:hypothetical protein